jgi:hypothetical protein
MCVVNEAFHMSALSLSATQNDAAHATKTETRRMMKRILCVLLLVSLMPSAYAAALPGDSAEGKLLHDANCMGCHDTGVYTRRDHRVRSLDVLKKQLGDCSHAAKKEFSAIETQNIIKYLNDHFYHFR